MSQYFPKPFRSFGGNINFKVYLSNYATKTDLKSVIHVDTSSFALKANLASLKTEVDKQDIDKLVLVPHTSNLVKKSDYNVKVSEIEGKMPSVSGLVTTSGLTAIENKISNSRNLCRKISTSQFDDKNRF